MNKEKIQFLIKLSSILIPFGFGIYSFGIGYMKGSMFHISIFAYYFILSFLRGILIFRKKESMPVMIFSSILMLISTIVLFAPITIMSLQKKEIHYTEIMAISVAAYTAYKVAHVCIQVFSRKKEKTKMDILILSLAMNNAILSVMNLQYTLSNTFDNGSSNMQTMSYYTNFLLLSLMVGVSVYAIVKIVGKTRKEKSEIVKKDKSVP